MLKPILIVLDVLQRDRLRADVAAAERVILIAPNIQGLVVVNPDLDSAYRLTKIAAAVVNVAVFD